MPNKTRGSAQKGVDERATLPVSRAPSWQVLPVASRGPGLLRVGSGSPALALVTGAEPVAAD